jgi:ribulose-phosphate 3-epimerase
MRLAPSILSADFTHLYEDISMVRDAGGLDLIHIDVMDGIFVPNISIGLPVIRSIRKAFPNEVLDTHLMIDRPERFIEDFAQAGSDIITVQAESTNHLQRVLTKIHSLGKKAGVAINPATPLCMLEHILCDCDMVLIMSVNPGFGGQSYIPQSTAKIAALKSMISAKGIPVDIEADGGIGASNIKTVTDAGADIIVAGSAIFGKPDIKKAVIELRNAVK